MITAKRLTYVLYILLALLAAGAIFITLYTNGWLTKRAQKLVVVKLETAALEEKQSNNQKAASELKKYDTTKQTLEKIVPKNKDQANALAEIFTIANEVGVTINMITFPASDLGAATKTVAGTTAKTPTTNSVTQAKPVDNIPGLLGIEVTLSQIERKPSAAGSGITYSQLITLLQSIERNRRTMQIKTIQVQPLKSATGNTIVGYTLTLTMNIFVKP